MSRYVFRAFPRFRFLALSIAALALVSSIFSPSPSFAAGGQTGTLQGTIVDSKTGAGIANVTVDAVAPSGAYKATTNGSGYFSILGMVVDTYTVSAEIQGYETISITGVTIPGDQILNLGKLQAMAKLKTIVRVRSTTTSAYQPGQTVDSYTVSGNRILETTGKTDTTNENDIILSVPGVSLTSSGTPTIRGGDPTEVGYQLDGVDFSEPFLRMNGSNGLVSGLGSIQVVEGAGDATQGDVGAGVINVVPKRGTNPATGELDLETGGPNFSHQLALNYGFATPNGRVSDYFSYTGQRFAPYNGYHLTDPVDYGVGTAGVGYQSNDQIENNFVFKFGRNNNQSLQALYTNEDQRFFGDAGGVIAGGPSSLAAITGDYANPNALNSDYLYSPVGDPAQLLGSVNAPVAQGGFGPGAFTLAGLQSIYPIQPYTSANPNSIINPQSQIAFFQQRFLKFEYDNNLDANTYLSLKYYNWESLNNVNYDTDSVGNNGVSYNGYYSTTGGPTTGGILELDRQIGSKLTISLNGQYEVLHPIWNLDQPIVSVYALSPFGTVRPSETAVTNLTDFMPGGYLSTYFPCLNSPGTISNCPRLPNWGVNYNQSFFQKYGAGIRLQYQPTSRLKIDLGMRNEQQYQHFNSQGYEQNNPNPRNIFDVLPSDFTNTQLDPHVAQPRGSIAYQMGSNDSLRFGYGRSAVFVDAQTAGTPFGGSGLGAFNKIPAKAGAICGLGGGLGPTFPCSSYAEELYWVLDAEEAPDAGGSEPAIYSNYDFTYQHRFSNGFAVHMTPFYKLGTDLPAAGLINTLADGQQIFGISDKGFNRTTGLEFELTTPDRPVGFAGFLSMTYQNVLQSAPPLSNGEAVVPLLSPATLALGNVYRAGYVSPFSTRIGGTYNFKNGLSVTPVIQYDRGYPFNLGQYIAAQLPNGTYDNVSQVNFGPGVTPIVGYENSRGTQQSSTYFDPAFPGSVSNPNISTTRGTPLTPTNGGALWKPNVMANLTTSYKFGRNVVGVQIANLFGNAYNGTIPLINPYYQPVATGLSGPLTGVNTQTSEFGTLRAGGNLPKDTYAYSNGAYLLSNGNNVLAPITPTAFTLYYQYKL